MRAKSRFQGSTWHLAIRLDPDDTLDGLGQWDIPIELTVPDCRVHLPRPVDPHPDLVGLAILSIVRPWVGKHLALSTPISSQLAEAIENSFGIEVGPVDTQMRPREHGQNATTGLSLGPDCLASDLLLNVPKNAFYFVRIPHPAIPDRATHIRHDVVLRRLQKAEDHGWRVEVARSDLEFMAARPFPTFAHWTTMFVGAILNADEQDFGYIVSGRHIGGHYIHSGQRFDIEADHDLRHRDVFRATGLELVSPVAGLTEVSTFILAREHELFGISSSCLLSVSPTKPCGACEKCFRKELISAWVEQRVPDPAILAWGEINERYRLRFERFETTPQPHTFAFVASRLDGLESTFLRDWVSRYPTAHDATSWVDKSYHAGIETWVPEDWRAPAISQLSAHVAAMTEEDSLKVESWPRALQAGFSQR